MARIKIIAGEILSTREVKEGELLAEVILEAGFFSERPCAGRGTCGKCKIVAKGALSSPTAQEMAKLSETDLRVSERLSCQARVAGDVEITLPSATVVTDKIFSGDYPVANLSGPFGIAIDLGTTTVGAFLATLADNRIHKGHAVLNSQTTFGAEVISRMEKALKGEAEELRNLAHASIGKAMFGLGLSTEQMEQIERAVVVGNSAMHHLFLGLPVDTLVRLPFEPRACAARQAHTQLFNREIDVWLPPLIGGFVGSDALACLIYLGFATQGKPLAAVDLGTNGEVMVTDGKRIVVASTAAGPAFEGVNIACGMRATRGAVTSARADGKGGLDFEVIGGVKPKGIAGSGLLSLVNLLRKDGRIDASGKINNGSLPLADKLYLAQTDIREVQKAKAAVRAAFDLLLKHLALQPEDLDELVLTGSFGARINIDDALDLRMIPPVPRERVRVFANAAGLGAGMMLSAEAFEFASELAENVRHVELHADQEFLDKYIGNMSL